MGSRNIKKFVAGWDPKKLSRSGIGDPIANILKDVYRIRNQRAARGPKRKGGRRK